jgi:IMP cyclohydrolase
MGGGLELLKSMTYPGRMIIIGEDPSGASAVAIYAITGRSPASQARRLVRKGDTVWVRPTDKEIIKKGNPELLIYPAIRFARGVVISNGRQTEDIRPDAGQTAVAALKTALRRWEYEPDPPAFTPRISGCILPGGQAALSMIKKAADGSARRSYFDAALTAGRAKLVSTYSGQNRDPLPSFSGSPRDLKLTEKTAARQAEAIFESLAPRAGEPDFRVAVACLFAKLPELTGICLHIINRPERTK